MRLVSAILALLLTRPCAALSLETAPSAKTEKEFARIEAQASASYTARRLFAVTRHVPRREVRGSELLDAIGVRGGAKPEIVVDALRLQKTSETDAELLLVLNAARAFLAFPIPIVEAEKNAWQRTLQFAAERGAEDPAGFGARLAKAVREGGARSDALERSALPLRTPLELSETVVRGLPEGTLERVGLLLHMFERDPQRFYRAIEAGTAWPRGSARLAELEGQRYPESLLRGTGEVERLRESLEAYDSVGLASVHVAINRWRRSVGQ